MERLYWELRPRGIMQESSFMGAPITPDVGIYKILQQKRYEETHIFFIEYFTILLFVKIQSAYRKQYQKKE